jgi:hypothetical protein
MGWKCNKCGKLINFSVEETWHGSGTEVIDGVGDIETKHMSPDFGVADIDLKCDCGSEDFGDCDELREYLEENAKYVKGE